MDTATELPDLGTIRMGSALAVADQIQAFALGRKTGVLHIFHSGESGRIFLLNGEVVDAVFGGRRGVQAAIDMINLPDPPTAFTLEEGSQFRTIQLSYVELLLEAARYQDESAAAQEAPASTERPARTPSPGFKFWLHGQEYVYRLDKDVLQIGRAKGNDLMILEPSISRHHARVERRDYGVTIHDLESANGTFVGGHRIKDAILQTGDEIRLGQVPAKFVVENLVEVTSARPTTRLLATCSAAESEGGAISAVTVVPTPVEGVLAGVHFPVIPAAPVQEMRRAG